MKIFEGQNLLEFAERFQTDEICKKYLSEVKWEAGYTCRKCKHTKYQERKDFSRTCNICNDTESPSANTLFHKVKFGMKKHFSFALKCQPLPKVFPHHKPVFAME